MECKVCGKLTSEQYCSDKCVSLSHPKYEGEYNYCVENDKYHQIIHNKYKLWIGKGTDHSYKWQGDINANWRPGDNE